MGVVSVGTRRPGPEAGPEGEGCRGKPGSQSTGCGLGIATWKKTFVTTVLLSFGARQFFNTGGLLGHCRKLSSIPGPHPLGPSGNTTPLV